MQVRPQADSITAVGLKRDLDSAIDRSFGLGLVSFPGNTSSLFPIPIRTALRTILILVRQP